MNKGKKFLTALFTLFALLTLFTFSNAGIHFGVGRAIQSEAKELSKEVGPSHDPILGAPYLNVAQMSIKQGYSTDSSNPWGRAHDGIDVYPVPSTGSLRSYIAAEEGRVTQINVTNSNAGRWQVNVLVKFNKTYSFSYAFETFSSSDSDKNIQVANIFVAEGQKVKKGDLIGNLNAAGASPHVHFGFLKNNSAICAESFFTTAVKNEMLVSLQQTYPTATKLCYP